VIDSAFFPRNGPFKFTELGHTGFAPEFVAGVVSVTVADTIVKADTDSLFLDADDPDETVPAIYDLAQNFPNPCNPSTTIKYSLETRGFVELSVYNILGRKVRTLVSAEKEVGWHEVMWDGKDDSGDDVSSGIYFYKMSSREYTKTKKMLLLK
jgi:hypothetical protein